MASPNHQHLFSVLSFSFNLHLLAPYGSYPFVQFYITLRSFLLGLDVCVLGKASERRTTARSEVKKIDNVDGDETTKPNEKVTGRREVRTSNSGEKLKWLLVNPLFRFGDGELCVFSFIFFVFSVNLSSFN